MASLETSRRIEISAGGKPAGITKSAVEALVRGKGKDAMGILLIVATVSALVKAMQSFADGATRLDRAMRQNELNI